METTTNTVSGAEAVAALEEVKRLQTMRATGDDDNERVSSSSSSSSASSSSYGSDDEKNHDDDEEDGDDGPKVKPGKRQRRQQAAEQQAAALATDEDDGSGIAPAKLNFDANTKVAMTVQQPSIVTPPLVSSDVTAATSPSPLPIALETVVPTTAVITTNDHEEEEDSVVKHDEDEKKLIVDDDDEEDKDKKDNNATAAPAPVPAPKQQQQQPEPATVSASAESLPGKAFLDSDLTAQTGGVETLSSDSENDDHDDDDDHDAHSHSYSRRSSTSSNSSRNTSGNVSFADKRLEDDDDDDGVTEAQRERVAVIAHMSSRVVLNPDDIPKLTEAALLLQRWFRSVMKARLTLKKAKKMIRKKKMTIQAHFDLNQSGIVELSAEEYVELKLCWKVFEEGLRSKAATDTDTKRRRGIRADQMGPLLRAIGQSPTDQEVKHMVHTMDTDRNGTIDFDEFVKWYRLRKTLFNLPFLLRELFKLFCGKKERMEWEDIQKTMFKHGVALTDEECYEMIRMFDVDYNGHLTQIEFFAMTERTF